ncbi:HNH endonuclease signature motif containing protein [Rhodococcus cerastii]|uniref:HNH endonuclease signature motif containing protein n=1 Tax=Rhodococcus cerastii TaxID=908616 RepID=A0ABU4D6F1_9NOCA|nr:HNH endonuclease signature motif containing protein [Rhodococcus cerastii]MDV6304862.1 HNH endonuclease signature motif containing protein [Rhodococcus cerastii]
MPSAPPRICPRCKQTTTARKCPTCWPAWSGSAWKNGSTRRWRKLRAEQLEQHPICQRPGCQRLAAEVDHIDNLAGGGEMYTGPLQSLCPPHHAEKTATERKRTSHD